LYDETLPALRQIAGTECLGLERNGEVVLNDGLKEAACLSDDALIALVAATRGVSSSVLKKSYFGDRRIELLATLLGRHPLVILENLAGAQWYSDAASQITREVLSVAVGSVFGRIDIRIVLDDTLATLNDDIFHELPWLFPGQLIGPDGYTAREGSIVGEEWLRAKAGQSAAPSDHCGHDSMSRYPLRISWDGIIVDDQENSDDIVRRVRDVLGVIWRGNDEAIEQEACNNLGVKSLREYFRKPGKGGFWDDHVLRYSKSRRNAPIYWLLQSTKRNYGLWVYYQRLSKDLLFKALVNYVEPKIRLETGRLETVYGQKSAMGDSGKEARRLAKEVERQEDLLSELRDFEDKLRRAANLHLEPDLNDGVVLNIAPLYELVPWKEAKNYWEELLAGKYEWSSIGKQLHQKGLVK
jgi:hypothetical protein